METNAGAIASRIVVVATEDTPVLKVAQMMREHHVGALVVVGPAPDDSRPIGIITDRDLVVEVMAKELDAGMLRAGDVMTPQPVAVSQSADVFETMVRMRQTGARRLPVVDDLGLLVGIVAMDDLIQLMARELGELSAAIAQEREREQRSRS